MFKNSFRTTKETQNFMLKEISLLMLFKETIFLRWESYKTHK
jgi:hypothetical protein